MPRIRNTSASQFHQEFGTDPLNFFLGGGAGGGVDQITGGGAADRIEGGTGNDILSGGAGNDVLFGGKGDDLLDVAGAGAPSQGFNTLFGGAGDDRLQLGEGGRADGGDGRDTIVVELAVGRLNGGAGRDHLIVGSDVSLIVDLRGTRDIIALGGLMEIKGFEDFSASFGDDTVTGTAGANRLYGDEGEDVLLGLAGQDRLNGGLGSDVLSGGAGRDVIGRDLSVDNAQTEDGGDFLRGDGGADRFLFVSVADSPDDNRDEITDFLAGVDRIDLRNFIDDRGFGVNFAFIGDDAFTAGDQLRFADGVLTGRLDDDAQIFTVALTGVTDLRDRDLLL
jgi:Ca2+-binding RTX toxin-like protein